ncbi:hypothetical protein HPP92_023108 [Vanilla planifolia]|uniref:Uncharacterized protein n=1 Tax=Vanilla planifolia TaxID=51239 RepID=A0A835PTH6_VANPL|nr:hypothetical protein HPP92_023108 [Vanilla planifolia]
MESNAQPTATETATATGKRLWHIVRAVFVMLREGLAKRRRLAELRLHLLLRRGKLAGKPFVVFSPSSPTTSTTTLPQPHTAVVPLPFPAASWTPTPPYTSPMRFNSVAATPPSTLPPANDRNDAAGNLAMTPREIARAFEFLDSVADEESSAEVSPLPSVLATPVVPVKQLRVTDSPFVDEEETEADDAVDRRAEEFIRSFYDRRRQEMIGF